MVRHSGCGGRAGARGLRRVGILLHSPATLVVGRHSAAASIRTSIRAIRRKAHSRVVVLRVEASAAAALALVATPVVSRAAMADCLVVGRRLRISSGMRASHRSRMRDGVLLHMTLGGTMSAKPVRAGNEDRTK